MTTKLTNSTEIEQTILGMTERERAIWELCLDSADGQGNDFGFTEDVVEASDEPARVVGAYLTVLSNKGLLRVHEPERANGTGPVYTQFDFPDAVRDFIEAAD